MYMYLIMTTPSRNFPMFIRI